MIKAAVTHNGVVHVLALVDDTIQHASCPQAWVKSRKTDDGKTEVMLSWPLPTKPQPPSNDVGAGTDLIRITRS